jgi:hypothetical protein
MKFQIERWESYICPILRIGRCDKETEELTVGSLFVIVMGLNFDWGNWR